jgi:hypothetical protein
VLGAREAAVITDAGVWREVGEVVVAASVAAVDLDRPERHGGARVIVDGDKHRRLDEAVEVAVADPDET